MHRAGPGRPAYQGRDPKLFGSISQTGDANKKAAIETIKGFADPGVIKNVPTIPDDKINGDLRRPGRHARHRQGRRLINLCST